LCDKFIEEVFLFRIVRHEVPAGFVSWDIEFDTYDPIVFDAHHLEGAPYADPMLESPDFDPKFNHIDGKINRKSHEGPYRVMIQSSSVVPASFVEKRSN